MKKRPNRRKKSAMNFGLLICLLIIAPFLPRKDLTGSPETVAAPAPPPRPSPSPTPPALVKRTRPEITRESAIVVRVVDGDTLDVTYRGRPDTVRFIGVDTPEKRDNEKARRDAARTGRDIATIIATGKAASSYLRSLIAPGAAIELEFDVRRRDKYGRLLSYVYRDDGTMLNEAMVLGGYASAYTLPPDVRYAERFRRAEQRARSERRGLWR